MPGRLHHAVRVLLGGILRRFPEPLNTNEEFPEIIGGPGRSRTCNRTVMSGKISIGSVDFWCDTGVAGDRRERYL